VSRPPVLVTGVGPGTGTAIARRFSTGGHDVAMLARNAERLAALETEIMHAKGYAYDVTDEAQLETTLAAVQRDFVRPSVLVHNAVGGAWGNFLEIDPKVLNANFQLNTMALLYLACRLALQSAWLKAPSKGFGEGAATLLQVNRLRSFMKTCEAGRRRAPRW
jgi:NAD(P)-dependent dehydrogenase (short-subunit alcohol dehydrogenase family)